MLVAWEHLGSAEVEVVEELDLAEPPFFECDALDLVFRVPDVAAVLVFPKLAFDFP